MIPYQFLDFHYPLSCWTSSRVYTFPWWAFDMATGLHLYVSFSMENGNRFYYYYYKIYCSPDLRRNLPNRILFDRCLNNFTIKLLVFYVTLNWTGVFSVWCYFKVLFHWLWQLPCPHDILILDEPSDSILTHVSWQKRSRIAFKVSDCWLFFTFYLYIILFVFFMHVCLGIDRVVMCCAHNLS